MKTTWWSKLRALSPAEVWCLVQAAAAVVAFDVALRLLSSKTCLALFDRKPSLYRRERGVKPQRMAWLVEVADRYAPGKPSCIRQAAALAWLLRRRGVTTSLRIGVAREKGKLVAHGWLESNDAKLFGLSERNKYALLSSPAVHEPLDVGLQS